MPETEGTPAPDVLEDVLWTEKYRPTRLEDVALDDDNRAVLSAYLAAGEVPHILFVGPPGTGKTTLSRIIYRALDCDHMVLNASNERGIDVVREKILPFARNRSTARLSIVFMDEFDATTKDTQTALRNLIENYSEETRFILTANEQYRVLDAIQSRCQVINLVAPPFEERFRVLAAVLKQEGIKATAKVTATYATHYTDMRKMLMGAQRAYLAKGMLPPAQEVQAVNGEAVLTLLLAKNWTGLRRLTATAGFDPSQGLRELFWAVPDEHDKAGFLRHIVGRAVHESGFTPDPVILFLATCAECLEGL